MKHPAPTTQRGVATWTIATCHPIPSAILDDLRQHLDCGTQVRVLLRLPGPVFTIDAALLARRRMRIHVEIMQRLDELNAVADGRPTTTSRPSRHWLAWETQEGSEHYLTHHTPRTAAPAHHRRPDRRPRISMHLGAGADHAGAADA